MQSLLSYEIFLNWTVILFSRSPTQKSCIKNIEMSCSSLPRSGFNTQNNNNKKALSSTN